MLNLFHAIREIHEQDNSYANKYVAYRDLLSQSFHSLLRSETIRLSDEFSRLTFLARREGLTDAQRFGLWHIWKRSESIASGLYQLTESDYRSDLKALVWGVAALTSQPVPPDFQQMLAGTPFPRSRPRQRGKRIWSMRVVFRSAQTIGEQQFLICDDEDHPNEIPLRVRISATDENKLFHNCAEDFWPGACLHLIDVLLVADETDVVVPRFIVLEPDYLLNVTDLAETFTDYGESPLYYLMKKLEPMPNTKAILLGNMANFFQDELLNETADQRHHFLHRDPQTGQYTGLFLRGFSQQPFAFSTCLELQTTDDFNAFREAAELICQNLRTTMELDFSHPVHQIRREELIIEPSFLSNDYGVQGRLDMLQREEMTAKVIELKSGKAPWPPGNLSLIKPNHESQLLLYRLMLQSALGYKFNNVTIYLLYAAATNGRLRSHSPVLRDSQRVMLQRNRIVAQEYRIANDIDGTVTRNTVESIGPDKLITREINPNFRAAIEPQMRMFQRRFAQASQLERSYAYTYISFISTELFFSKTGGGQADRNGHASLWRDPLPAKIENGCILFDLFIKEDKSTHRDKELTFEIPSYKQDYLPNFRQGDVCVLYERNSPSNFENGQSDDAVLKTQIFKCTIASINARRVKVQLRYQQSRADVFNPLSRWALEPDSMETNFVAMYKGLYTLLGAEPDVRSRLLTVTPPVRYTSQVYNNPDLSEQQNKLIANALTAPDYFLVIGPPGTGKTRIMLANLVTELYRNPTQNLLLLAYTNRAVDEICEAVTTAIGGESFVRIGSRLSCDSLYHNNLLDVIASNAQSRAGLRQKLDSRRIFIATLASLAGCMELFELKKFGIAIVDEASQILEPQLIGVLTKVPKFILIGDQKQLPAIVLQTPKQAQIPANMRDLAHIGLCRRDESYFERLIRRCQQQKWTWAFGMLDIQGRMHEELALFPNHSFYQGQLKTRADDAGEPSRFGPLMMMTNSDADPIDQLLATRRLLLFPSEPAKTAKLNDDEARLAANIVARIVRLYGSAFKPKKTVGVITPYRRQIAQIRKYLREANVPYAEDISVDTVERYQGSQRDVIIYSFAVNSSRQIEFLRNDYFEGETRIDRKLNVAITRARQQIIYIGSESLLTTDGLFYRLIEFVKSKGGYVAEGVKAALTGNITIVNPNTEQTVAGKQYMPSASFEQIFDTHITQPLRAKSISWPQDFGGFSADVCRNIIIEYGRANFEQSVLAPTVQGKLIELGPAERVKVYCLFNMRKHYFTTFAILESYSDYLSKVLKDNGFRVSYIDIGCGPMTSGMAFQQFLNTLKPGFGFSYFGIDCSQAMLDQAHAFSHTPLFGQAQKKWYGLSLTNLPEAWLEDVFRLPNVVIINTCYLFGNLDINSAERLAGQLSQLMQRFPLNRYILMNQNPKTDRRNRAYNFFRKTLIGLDKLIASKIETVTYRNQYLSRYDKTEEVFYEIWSN